MNRFSANSGRRAKGQVSKTANRSTRRRNGIVAGALAAALATAIGSVSTGSTPIEAYSIPTDSPGPKTQGGYLPAPNPATYCASPDYFGRWSQAQAVLDAGSGYQLVVNDTAPTHDDGSGPVADFSTVSFSTSDGTPNGTPTTPGVWQGNPNAPLGIVLQGPPVGGTATASGNITFDQPLFFSQWVYPDTDLKDEGFDLTPSWATSNADLHALAIYGGDPGNPIGNRDWSFTPTSGTSTVVTNSGSNTGGETLEGRVQADFLGPLNGFFVKRTGSGNLGFIGGSGCAAIGISKEATTPVWDPATKTFVVDYTLRVFNNMPTVGRIQDTIAAGQASSLQDANNVGAAQLAALGNLVETDLQVIDALDLTGFAGASISTPPASPDGATVNTNYDGVADTKLLLGIDTLEQEGVRTITFSVTYEPDFAAPEWADCAAAVPNQATTSARLEGIAVSDLSDNGGNPLPAEENGYGGVDDPTPLEFSYDCSIGLAKDITAGPTSNGDGSYDVTYSFVAENTGTVPLYAIDIADDLQATFGSAYVSQTTDSDTCATLTDGLAPAATCSKAITVTIKPVDNLGPWDNSATVTAGAGSADGVKVTDVSQDGTNPDPDGDGDPTNNNVPTSLELKPAIGLTKNATAGPTAVGDGTFDVTYELVATNTGAAYIDTVSINDDLLATFGGAYVSGQVDSDTCAGNGLDIGASCTQVVSVVIKPGAITDWTNNATVAGTAGGVDVDAQASETISITEAPAIGLAKRVVSNKNNGDGTYTVTYELVVENFGDTSLTNIALSDDIPSIFGTALVNYGVTANTCEGITLASPKLGSGTTTCSQTIVVVVKPGAKLAPYDNTANVSGTSPGGATVTDQSQNGTETDPDGDGNPGNNSELTPVTFTESPEVGLAKTLAGPPVNNGDGTYTVTYDLLAENTGDVPLSDIKIADDLETVFGAAYIPDAEVTSDTCDGITLMPPDTVAGTPGDTCAQTIAVKVKPGSNLGPYDNTATVEGTSPSGAMVTDVSQDGTDVDPDGDGPGNNSDPTPVSFTENPVVGLAKHITAGPTSNGDGTYNLTYELVAKNMGDVALSDVTIDDDLTAAFADAVSFEKTVTADTCDGITLQPSMPAGNGDTCSITLSVKVTPGADLGPYENSAEVTATSPSGKTVTDVSQDNPPTTANPDLNGDGDPTNDSDPTVTSFAEAPGVGIAKAAYNLRDVGGGKYAVDYVLNVANTGDITVNKVLVVDNLDTTFGDVKYEVSDVASTTLTVNSGFTGAAGTDGTVDTDDLLDGTDSLAVDETGSITFTVTFTPAGNYGPFDNTATIEGTSPAGQKVGDNSVDGAKPDADGDGDPTNDTSPTTIAVPAIGITKSLVSAEPLGGGNYAVTYQLAVTNVGPVELKNVQVQDDLAATYTGADGWEFTSASSDDLTISAAYDGDATIDMLAGTDTMAVGQVSTIKLVVKVTALKNLGPFDNTAVANGVGPDQTLPDGTTVPGPKVTDESRDTVPTDTNPDGNGNGDPTDDTSPTTVSFSEKPEISLTKRVSSGPTLNGTSFNLSYELVATNTGDVPLTNVSVTDDLRSVFATGSTIVVQSISATAPGTANAAYNGTTNTELLATTLLNPGESTTITVNLLLSGVGGTSSLNSADAKGTSPAGQLASDRSQDGTNPDPDGDGNPTNNSVPTPAAFPIINPPRAGLSTFGPTTLALGFLVLGGGLLLFSRRRRRSIA